MSFEWSGGEPSGKAYFAGYCSACGQRWEGVVKPHDSPYAHVCPVGFKQSEAHQAAGAPEKPRS